MLCETACQGVFTAETRLRQGYAEAGAEVAENGSNTSQLEPYRTLRSLFDSAQDRQRTAWHGYQRHTANISSFSPRMSTETTQHGQYLSTKITKAGFIWPGPAGLEDAPAGQQPRC